MKTTEVFTIFAASHRWNALVQVAHKLSFALLSFSLYRVLTDGDFSAWANINSVIFLTLLWADLGLRKAIPRYAPWFTASHNDMKRFITGVVLMQVGVVVASLLPLQWIVHSLLAGKSSTFIVTAACIIFLVEGCTNILRLLHHAHFWIRQYNQVAAIASLIEVTVNLLIIYLVPNSIDILKSVLATKIVIGLGVVCITSWSLRRLVGHHHVDKTADKRARPSPQEFMKHAGAMWLTSGLKSLSERNFMLPFFTYTLGAETANLFKITNDAALVFYRVALKTIGTTDTALLAHIDAAGWQKNLVRRAFSKLTVRIAALSLPLFGIALLSALLCRNVCSGKMFLTAFLIMTSAYLVELMLLPYERILEVKRRYKSLARAYMLYIVGLACTLFVTTVTSIGLIGSLLCVHIVRLVSLYTMTRIIQRSYKLELPHHHIGIIVKASLYGLLLITALIII